MTRDQRVFYVAFKWVQEHWPRNVEEGEHIADVPISLYLDNQEVPNLVYNFKAKIRVYNTAAHLVICEWVQECWWLSVCWWLLVLVALPASVSVYKAGQNGLSAAAAAVSVCVLVCTPPLVLAGLCTALLQLVAW